MLEVAAHSKALLLEGVPLRGVCLYPILGMPEWHEPDVWTPMGLWDPVCHRDSPGERLLCAPMHDALLSVHHIDELHHTLMKHREKLRFFRPRQGRRVDADFAEVRQRRAGLGRRSGS
jgi:hypothetical protein